MAQPRVEAAYQCFGETPYFLVQEHPAKDANQPFTHPLGAVQRASQLLGMATVNYIGERPGEVRDMVVNLAEGRLVEVMIASGPYLGMSGELPARSAPGTAASNPNHTVIFDTTKEALTRAPHFPENAWPQLDRGQITSVYQAHITCCPTSCRSVRMTHAGPALPRRWTKPPIRPTSASPEKFAGTPSGRGPVFPQMRGRRHRSSAGQRPGHPGQGRVVSQGEKLSSAEIAAREPCLAPSQVDNQLEIKESGSPVRPTDTPLERLWP